MKLRLGLVVLLVALAGCAAPAPDSGVTTHQPTEPEPTTETPTTAVTTTETVKAGVEGTIENTTVENDVVVATIALRNYDHNATTVSIAVRFVENDSFAKVGELKVEPGQTETRTVGLPTYGDEPANLTVQLRIDGRIVAERSAV